MKTKSNESAKTKNKYTKWAMGWSAAAMASFFFVPVLDLVLSAFSLYLGIRGLRNYNKNNSLGGKPGAVVSIILSSIILLLSIVKIIGIILTMVWLGK